MKQRLAQCLFALVLLAPLMLPISVQAAFHSMDMGLEYCFDHCWQMVSAHVQETALIAQADTVAVSGRVVVSEPIFFQTSILVTGEIHTDPGRLLTTQQLE